MKLHSLKIAGLLLLCCRSLFADPVAAPVQTLPSDAFESLDSVGSGGAPAPSSISASSNAPVPDSGIKADQTISDPTAMTEKLKRGMAGVLVPTDTKAAPAVPVPQEDPTRMNQNFRDALKRMTQGGTGSGGAVQKPSLPEISLVASACSMHKDQNHAMLRVNGKTEMVSEGDTISAILKNQVVEIRVLEIDKMQVKIELLPANEIIVLR